MNDFWMVFAVSLAIATTFVGIARVLEKAGKSGLAATVPGLNFCMLIEAAQLPRGWAILALFPPVTFFVIATVSFELAYRFGRGTGTAMGLMFLPMVFYPLLGLGPAQYSAVDAGKHAAPSFQ